MLEWMLDCWMLEFWPSLQLGKAKKYPAYCVYIAYRKSAATTLYEKAQNITTLTEEIVHNIIYSKWWGRLIVQNVDWSQLYMLLQICYVLSQVSPSATNFFSIGGFMNRSKCIYLYKNVSFPIFCEFVVIKQSMRR